MIVTLTGQIPAQGNSKAIPKRLPGHFRSHGSSCHPRQDTQQDKPWRNSCQSQQLTSQCQSIAKMLAGRTTLLYFGQGPKKSGEAKNSSSTDGGEAEAKNKSRESERQKVTGGIPPGQDKAFIQSLLDGVDRAIAQEYGTDNTEALSFKEIFEALKAVETKHKQRRQAMREHEQNGNSYGQDSKRIKLSGGWRCNTLPSQAELDKELLLLSYSEEKMLLRDLEREARNMTLEWGEGLSSTLTQRQSSLNVFMNANL